MGNPGPLSLLEEFADLVVHARNIVIMTGAGISTESGISDYRSRGGLWDRFQPVTIQEFLASEEKRKDYWRRKMELYKTMAVAKPNVGHRAITVFHKQGKLLGLITQNIDGLHQMAGLPDEKILEIHGTNRQTVCLSCREITAWEESYRRIQQGESAPLCLKCGGLLKPNTISFGQALDADILRRSIQWAGQCDLFCAIGSSLVVEPAASLPRIAKQNGASLVILTRSETPLDSLADICLREPIGKTLETVLGRMEKILTKGES